MDIWDVNFKPGQQIQLPIHLFNDTQHTEDFKVLVTVENKKDNVVLKKAFNTILKPFSKNIEMVSVRLPKTLGDYQLKTTLLNPTKEVKHKVVSTWDIRIFKSLINDNSTRLKVGVLQEEKELRDFVLKQGFKVTNLADPDTDFLIGSTVTWKKISKKDTSILNTIEQAINNNTSVLLLDIDDIFLGQFYVDYEKKMSRLQGSYKLQETEENVCDFIKGTQLKFTKVAEPENHIHPPEENAVIWNHINKNDTWLWNGLRGGLIVPANEIEVTGLRPEAFLTKWKSKGANPKMLSDVPYYAYELQGYYRFSTQKEDHAIEKELKDYLHFLIEDAPALATSLNPNAKIKITDLHGAYKNAFKGQAQKIIPLVNCGKNLTRVPVLQLEFGEAKGKIILSQLITKERLAPNQIKTGIFDKKIDPVAIQMVINMQELLANNATK